MHVSVRTITTNHRRLAIARANARFRSDHRPRSNRSTRPRSKRTLGPDGDRNRVTLGLSFVPTGNVVIETDYEFLLVSSSIA